MIYTLTPTLSGLGDPGLPNAPVAEPKAIEQTTEDGALGVPQLTRQASKLEDSLPRLTRQASKLEDSHASMASVTASLK